MTAKHQRDDGVNGGDVGKPPGMSKGTIVPAIASKASGATEPHQKKYWKSRKATQWGIFT
jgi:hypothetical protein